MKLLNLVDFWSNPVLLEFFPHELPDTLLLTDFYIKNNEISLWLQLWLKSEQELPENYLHMISDDEYDLVFMSINIKNVSAITQHGDMAKGNGKYVKIHCNQIENYYEFTLVADAWRLDIKSDAPELLTCELQGYLP